MALFFYTNSLQFFIAIPPLFFNTNSSVTKLLQPLIYVLVIKLSCF